LPQKEADTVTLFAVYASAEAFQVRDATNFDSMITPGIEAV
jgi:hypothetical protein